MGKSMLHCLLAALLVSPGSSHLLAQQRHPRLASAEAGGQHLALAEPVAPPAQVQKPAPQPYSLQTLAPGTQFRDCADCPDMVVIPPGYVVDPPGRDASLVYMEEPRRSVVVPDGYAVGKYEVTRAQFAHFVQEAGHSTSGGCYAWDGRKYRQDPSRNWRKPGFPQTDRDPVVCVNWNDAKAYTEWLSANTGKRYRLLTEAEWEYAARAGTQTPWPWGDDGSLACRYANVADAAAKRKVPGTAKWNFHDCDDKHAYTAPVGSYLPNAFGLYDMTGNAWEWTEDCAKNGFPEPPDYGRDNESGDCKQRVLRGGAWVDSSRFVRYDFRFGMGAQDRDFYAGFRVARPE